jgi:hypothetical protein
LTARGLEAGAPGAPEFEYKQGMQANPTEGFQSGDDAGTETAHAHSSLTHMCVHPPPHARKCACTHPCTRAHTCTQTCVRRCTRKHTRARTDTYMHACTILSTHATAYAHARTHACIQP